MENQPTQVDGFSKIMKIRIARAPNKFEGSLHCVYANPVDYHLISSKVYLANFPLDCFYSDDKDNRHDLYLLKHKTNEVELRQPRVVSRKCCAPTVMPFAVKTAKILNFIGESESNFPHI